MDYGFKGKVALITGAAAGIGLETAKRFAEEGAVVYLTDVNLAAAEKEAALLRNSGADVTAAQCDVVNEQQVKELIASIVDKHGHLDFAYNNAGVQAPVAELADADGAEFDRAVAINLRGIWNCLKYELIQMRQQQAGAIVNCSSLCGIVAMPGMGAYVASKHAVIGLTKTAALDYAAQGIRINAICPGTTDTPMVAKAIADYPEHMAKSINQIPLKRIATAREMADTVLWLCSPGAGFVTGQAIVPDGGYSIM